MVGQVLGRFWAEATLSLASLRSEGIASTKTEDAAVRRPPAPSEVYRLILNVQERLSYLPSA